MSEVIMLSTAELAQAMFASGDRSEHILYIGELIQASEQKKNKEGIIYFIK